MTEFTRRHFAAFAASGLAHRAVVFHREELIELAR